MKEEIWKNIPDYEGYYQISNLGKVRSLTRVVKNKNKWDKINGTMIILGKLKEIQKRPNKRTFISLYKNGSQKLFSIYRLIAIAFLPNPNNKPCINHKDGNPENNNINNLEWCTYSENTIHAYKNKLFPNDQNVGEKNGRAILRNIDVINIRLILNEMNGINEHKYNDLAKIYKVSRTTIYRIDKRTHWKI